MWNYGYINPNNGFLNRPRRRTRPRPRVLKRLKSFEDEHEHEDEHETATEFVGNRYYIDLAQFLFFDQTGRFLARGCRSYETTPKWYNGMDSIFIIFI